MKKKIYIAGFDVFRQDSIEIGKYYKNLCEKYGFIGLYPIDNEVDFNQEKNKIACDIFEANKNMILQCDIIIANLNPFRGKESDSGTVWECGFGYGLGKEVYGYIKSKKVYLENFSKNEKRKINGVYVDNEDMVIEDFDLALNLMIGCSVKKLVFGEFEDVLKVISAK
jgi:nucleoside 2-deoxyribosyltransferase